MRRIYKGEKRYIGIEVYREEETPFTIDTAKYAVTGDEHAAIGDTGNAVIVGPKVYCILDTSQAIYVAGETYYVYFNVTITGLTKVIKGRVQIEIESDAEFS